MLRPYYLIEFIKKEDSYFNWSKLGNGKKSVKRTVPLTLTAIGMVVGAGAVAYRSLNEWKEKTKEIETNQMFFYYKIKKLIRK